MSYEWVVPVVTGVVIITAVVTNKNVKAGKNGIEVFNDKKPNNESTRDRWNAVVLSGFEASIRAYTGFLMGYLTRGLERYFLQSFISLLKSKGVPHENIRNHKEVLRYEVLLGMSFRRVVIPFLLHIMYKNNIPGRAKLEKGTKAEKEEAMRWYVKRYNDVWGDSANYIAGIWTIDIVTHKEVKEYYLGSMYDVLIDPLIDMFEDVKNRRETIFSDMKIKLPSLDLRVASERWEELYLLMGYIDILRGY